MNYFKYVLTNLILILFVLGASANPFEGVIFFQKTEGDNITFFKYYVKGDNIRIEDVNEGGKLNGILLIDIKTVSLKMLSCSSQLYIEVPLSPPAEKPQVKIEKTGEIKVINGEECELWKVVDAKEFSRYEYWVNEGNYSFFSPMLRILNRKDKIALAWVSLNVNENYFPFEGTEYSSTGKVITRLEVIEIKEKVLDSDLFNIPPNYSLFERRINN